LGADPVDEADEVRNTLEDDDVNDKDELNALDDVNPVNEVNPNDELDADALELLLETRASLLDDVDDITVPVEEAEEVIAADEETTVELNSEVEDGDSEELLPSTELELVELPKSDDEEEDNNDPELEPADDEICAELLALLIASVELEANIAAELELETAVELAAGPEDSDDDEACTC
jgi:hypothetical protein